MSGVPALQRTTEVANERLQPYSLISMMPDKHFVARGPNDAIGIKLRGVYTEIDIVQPDPEHQEQIG